MTDITSGLSSVLDLIFEGLTFCYNTLDSIGFMGISLLDYTIWLFVLGIIIPIIVTVIPSRGIEMYSEMRPGSRAVDSARGKAREWKQFNKAYDKAWNDEGEFFK